MEKEMDKYYMTVELKLDTVIAELKELSQALNNFISEVEQINVRLKYSNDTEREVKE